jgi:hypothetical protein
MNKGALGVSNERIDTTLGRDWADPGVLSGNCLIGYQAGLSLRATNTLASGTGAGAYNTIIGCQAASAAGTGDSVVSIGYQAGPAGSSQSTCIGYQAGTADAGSGQNVYIGYQAAVSLPGQQNVIIGYQAEPATTTVNGTVEIGFAVNSHAFSGVSIGSNVSSYGGVCIGSSSSNTSGQAVAIGFLAKAAAGTNGCVSVGNEAGQSSSGNDTTLLGAYAGVSNTATGAVCIGAAAGRSNTSGVNTMVGYQSGYTGTSGANATTTGTGQTLLGSSTGSSIALATQLNYITCLGYGVTAGASGVVAIGTDHTGTAATSSTQDVIALGTSSHQVQLSKNTTGAGSALLGTNCPAVTATAPYTWITMMAGDGSTVYVPCWK